MLHAGPSDPPRARVLKVRGILDALAQTAIGDQPYGAILQNEAKRLARQPASYILGEFLASENVAFHVRDVISGAGRHGLAYLSEGDLASSAAEHFFPAASATIGRIAGPDPLLAQQYIDVFSGRTFRRSLFVRRESAARNLVPPRAENMETLHIASPVKRAETSDNSGTIEFVDHRGRTFTIRDDIVAHGLACLGGAYPSTHSVRDIVGSCEPQAAPQRDAARVRMRHALYRLVAGGRAVISTEPLSAGRADAAYPEAWMLARHEAASGQPWITSLRHVAIPLSPVLRLLIPRLDGRHGRTMLADRLGVALNCREITAPEPSRTPTSSGHECAATIAERLLDAALDHLAKQAVLSPSSSSDLSRGMDQ
jgi:hypothetical protein